MSRTPAEHWDDVYLTRPATQLSWYQDRPATSLRLLRRACGPDASVLDVGAGSSALAEALIDAGWTDVTVLDVAAEAVASIRTRLGDRVAYVTADVLGWDPGRTFDVWHDRAVFHFLVDEDAQAAYVDTAARAVRPGGALVVATFAEDGPSSCSGLPTARYDAEALAEIFSAHCALEHAERESHVTPDGSVQPFTWVVLRRR